MTPHRMVASGVPHLLRSAGWELVGWAAEHLAGRLDRLAAVATDRAAQAGADLDAVTGPRK